MSSTLLQYTPQVEVVTPVAASGPLVRQMTTYRAWAAADNAMRVFVRDENGRHNLSGVASLTVNLYRYGSICSHPLVSVDATLGETVGEVDFTLDAATMNQSLPCGLYRFDVIADSVNIYPALLEVA